MAPIEGTDEFFWSSQPEPHDARKKALIAKYGKQINALMGPEPTTKYLGLIPVLIQLFAMVLVRDCSWPVYLTVAYVVGGTANHSIFLLIHEVTHFLAFRSQLWNDFYAMVVNIPIAVPYAMTFKFYHAEHHRYQGWDGVDADIPLPVEASIFHGTVGKLLFCTFQIFFYAFRPMFVRQPPMTPRIVINWIIIVSANYYIVSTFGWSALLYLALSSFFAGMLHPMSGHFIAEHYMHIWHPTSNQETFSYYGPLNVVAWNVGLHNEHHDFPNIPWSRLPQLRAIAPEFYEPLVKCDSWPGTIWRFIVDPHVTLFSRMKREKHAGERSTLIATPSS